MIIGANGDSLFKRLMKVPHRESVFGDGKSPQEWSTAFFAPENMDGEWWRMKWCLEIYWNLPPLWFLFRDSLGWCYQWDRLRGLKISGQKISDKSLNKWLPGLLHFTDISDWSGGVIFDSHTGWFLADHSLGLCVDTVTYVDGVLWCTIKSRTLGFGGFGWAD